MEHYTLFTSLLFNTNINNYLLAFKFYLQIYSSQAVGL